VKLEHDYVPRILEILDRWAAEPAKPAPNKTITLTTFSRGARTLIAGAQKLADDRRHSKVTTIHILSRLLTLSAAHDRLTEAGADPAAALAAAESILARMGTSQEPAYLSSDVLALLTQLERDAAGKEVSLSALLTACVTLPVRKTLEEVDAEGIDTRDSDEEAARRSVVITGKLDRLVRR
jgi:ATP-dependent Clp protease ATP-binding subunit ClpA